MFFNLFTNNPGQAVETKVTFNEMPFEQSVLHIPLIIIGSQQGTAKWVPLDWLKILYITAQKMKFSITDFFSKCDQIRRKLINQVFVEE